MDGQGIFSPPQNPKGGNQKHTMNYWKKKRILSSNSGNYGDIHSQNLQLSSNMVIS